MIRFSEKGNIYSTTVKQNTAIDALETVIAGLKQMEDVGLEIDKTFLNRLTQGFITNNNSEPTIVGEKIQHI